MRNLELIVTCPCCKKNYSVFVSEYDYREWEDSSSLVQDAFPYLNADERELLISGICNKCWDKMFF